MRPRWLYFWLFAWFASQGRFTSLFLEDIGLSETNIGILFSMRSLISLFVTPPVSLYADKLVANVRQDGYELVVGFLAIISTIFFLLHGLAEFIPSPLHRFYYIFIIRNLYSASSSPIYSVIDGIALKYLTDHGEGKEGYGKERMYGAVSWAIVSFLLGIAIDYYSPKIMHLFMIISLIPLLICIWMIGRARAILKKHIHNEEEGEYELVENPFVGKDIEDSSQVLLEDEAALLSPIAVLDQQQQQRQQVGVEGKEVQGVDEIGDEETDIGVESEEDYCLPTNQTSSNAHVSLKQSSYLQQLLVILALFFSSISGVLFILLILVLRMGTSIVENLIFLFFTKELGSSNFICGLSVVVTVLFEIPIFHYSSSFLSSLDRNGLMILACLAYSTRVVGYTLLSSPWYILFLEPLHGVTYAFSTIATVDYVAGMVPSDLQATGQGLLGSLQTGIGTLIGVGLGGYVEETYGSLVLYRGAGSLVAVMLGLYVLGVRCEQKRSREVKKEIERGVTVTRV